jgi:hypothetical protein
MGNTGLYVGAGIGRDDPATRRLLSRVARLGNFSSAFTKSEAAICNSEWELSARALFQVCHEWIRRRSWPCTVVVEPWRPVAVVQKKAPSSTGK